MASKQPDISIKFGMSFEGQYDRKSQCLVLTDVEEVTGRRITLQFPPIATRALYDLLIQLAQLIGGPLGADDGKGATKQ